MQKAQPAIQLLGRQSSTYRGGWPQGFIGTTCSGDAPVKCQPYDSYNLNCCPMGQTCSSGWPVYCCPTKESCGTVVTNLPACANSTWKMFELQGDFGSLYYFCCPKGMVGIIPSQGKTGICQENVAGISPDLLATSASQFGNILTTTTPGEPAATANNGGGGDGSGTINTPNGGDNPGTNTNPNGGAGGTTGSSNTGSSGSASGGNAISPGAIAGIVIGALIVLILGLALVLWIHRQSLRRNPPGLVVAAHPPPPQSPKPVGVAQVRPLVSTGGDAPEVVQYSGGPPGIPIYSAPQHATVVQTNGVSMAGFEGDIVSGEGESPLPQGAAPAYSPPLEVSGVGRAEMEVPRG